MKSWDNTTQTVQTKLGEVLIMNATPPELLADLSIDAMLQSFRPAKRQKEALVEISKLPEGKVTTAQLAGEIVGYITFHPPDRFERWSQGPDRVIELGAIEVAPKIRRLGVGQKLLRMSFKDARMEDYIVISTEYYWHWDLEDSGMHIWEYREMMRRIMESVGMVIRDTDEEEISSHPANILMARYGANVPPSIIKEFEDLLFMDNSSLFYG